ncbi:hypothetical protein AJ79_04548 [Helicocarpus griseus UAMH5409]|uniref:CCHC-type domain-containing protein n=1 Tax=Helicocarpus griseus UAMH5409 TaxID=1447875 RepID=A0A2B7XSU8_9EURO|nr:hypothetical protein AJ79_04548 [Helicocarpus griseus UAMH5409]
MAPPNQTQQIQSLSDQVAELIAANRKITDDNRALMERLETLETANGENTQPTPAAASGPQITQKVKLREPDVFEGNTDIRFWILDIDDNIRERLITSDSSKIAFGISYLTQKIRQRVQRMQIDKDVHVSSWEVLKVWLLDNYGETNSGLNAEIRMNDLQMKYNQKATDFITDFETIAADLKWNDPALCATFRSKLTAPILKQINQAYFNSWPESFSAWKKAVLTAESHISMTKQLLPTYANRQVRFDGIRSDNVTRDNTALNSGRGRSRSPRGSNRNPDISDTEYWRRQRDGSCTWCAKRGHWASECRTRLASTSVVPSIEPRNTPRQQTPGSVNTDSRTASATPAYRTRSASPKTKNEPARR